MPSLQARSSRGPLLHSAEGAHGAHWAPAHVLGLLQSHLEPRGEQGVGGSRKNDASHREREISLFGLRAAKLSAQILLCLDFAEKSARRNQQHADPAVRSAPYLFGCHRPTRNNNRETLFLLCRALCCALFAAMSLLFFLPPACALTGLVIQMQMQTCPGIRGRRPFPTAPPGVCRLLCGAICSINKAPRSRRPQ